MEAYGDFAYVYDELMDNTPYEEWCERIVQLIEKFGVSRPQRESGLSEGKVSDLQEEDASDDSLEADIARNEKLILASERNLVVDLGCGTGTLTQMLYH